MTTCLGKSCSFGLPRLPFVNCCQFMYLVISFLVLRAGCVIWLYRFLIISYLFNLLIVIQDGSWPIFYVNVIHSVDPVFFDWYVCQIFYSNTLVYIANGKTSCSILQQFTGRKCVTLFDAVLWRHPSHRLCLLDVRRCNVVFAHYKHIKISCERLHYSPTFDGISSVHRLIKLL